MTTVIALLLHARSITKSHIRYRVKSRNLVDNAMISQCPENVRG